MTDIAVGTALWTGLVRQIAVCTHTYDDTKDLLRTVYRKAVRHRAQALTDNVAAFPVRTAINSNNDNCRYSMTFEAVNALMGSVCSRPRA